MSCIAANRVTAARSGRLGHCSIPRRSALATPLLARPALHTIACRRRGFSPGPPVPSLDTKRAAVLFEYGRASCHGPALSACRRCAHRAWWRRAHAHRSRARPRIACRPQASRQTCPPALAGVAARQARGNRHTLRGHRPAHCEAACRWALHAQQGKQDGPPASGFRPGRPSRCCTPRASPASTLTRRGRLAGAT